MPQLRFFRSKVGGWTLTVRSTSPSTTLEQTLGAMASGSQCEAMKMNTTALYGTAVKGEDVEDGSQVTVCVLSTTVSEELPRRGGGSWAHDFLFLVDSSSDPRAWFSHRFSLLTPASDF